MFGLITITMMLIAADHNAPWPTMVFTTCIGFSLLLLVYLEAEKIAQGWRRQSHADA